MKALKTLACVLALGTVAIAVPASAADLQSIIAGYSANADPAAGKALFNTDFTGRQGPKGKAETAKCQACHDGNPTRSGQTRTGKTIGPMAVSAGYRDPDTGLPRYVDDRKREKWFMRNCTGVLGRECTNQEKADFLAYMASQ